MGGLDARGRARRQVFKGLECLFVLKAEGQRRVSQKKSTQVGRWSGSSLCVVGSLRDGSSLPAHGPLDLGSAWFA